MLEAPHLFAVLRSRRSWHLWGSRNEEYRDTLGMCSTSRCRSCARGGAIRPPRLGCRLLSRRGHVFPKRNVLCEEIAHSVRADNVFPKSDLLCEEIGHSARAHDAVLDGETHLH
jgi:hypothetical protein